ncbi:hypothetical protein DIS24_g12549 [Lasiodiplodia hormozganensis]|uniref:Uncharacterized protein n=1 Tax=Lasiodiplodia hormozganensis TaxID=869390 RepID=A0AA39TL14_9PEZI|nr:hypothetical protein DIS24_g12549 [Lasiodiplodia hormozganensis]
MVDTGPKTDDWGALACVMKQQVLVVWHDEEKNVGRHLGCLYEPGHEDTHCEERSSEIHKGEGGYHQAENEHANCQGNLSLETHRSTDADSAAVVIFHLPVMTVSRAKPKHMYIVIPTSGLSVTKDVESIVPESIRKHLPPASSRIRLELSGSEAPYAIMPGAQKRRRQVGKLLDGIAGQSIMNLKSICKTKSWDVFLIGHSAVTDQIDATCRLLHEGHVSGPQIDLRSIYNDGVRGCINNWHDYPYEESDHSDPPPYHAVAPRHPRSPNAVTSKRSQSEDELYWKSSPVRYRPTSSCEDDTVQAATSTKRKKGPEEEPDDDAAATPHKHFRKATFLSNLKPSLTDVAVWHQRLDAAPTLSPTQADTESFAPLHDRVPPAEDPGVLADKIKVAIANSPSPDPTLPPTSQSVAATDVSNPQPDCHAGPAELYFKMAEFLLYCLRIDPFAATRYKKELRQMARFVYQQEDAVFHSVKRDCLYDLSNHSARRELPMQPPGGANATGSEDGEWSFAQRV